MKDFFSNVIMVTFGSKLNTFFGCSLSMTCVTPINLAKAPEGEQSKTSCEGRAPWNPTVIQMEVGAGHADCSSHVGVTLEASHWTSCACSALGKLYFYTGAQESLLFIQAVVEEVV